LACGNGIMPLDTVVNSLAIVQSFHQAAASQALLTRKDAMALSLLQGLAKRIEDSMTGWEGGNPHQGEDFLAAFISLSASLGVPLTWREVRFVHQMIAKAYDAYVTQKQAWEYDLFGPSAPDGSFPLEPAGAGFRWVALATPIGSCAAAYVNPTTKP